MEDIDFYKRKEDLVNKLKNATENEQDLGLIYAIENGCYPYFHKGFDNLESEFFINRDLQEPFYEMMENMYSSKNYITYYEIENEFKIVFDKSKAESRHLIITMLRYAVLSGKYTDKDFKNKLLTQGEYPIEAKDIFEKYNPQNK